MLQRILVALDGSKLGEMACPYAEEIAKALGSEVVLVSICKPNESQYRHMHQLYIQKMADLMRTHLREAKVKWVVLDGRPAEQIIDYAEKNSGIMPWAMGNIPDKVMQRVSIPVLLVKVTDLTVEKGPLLSKILIPLDGSESGEAPLPYIRELASKLKSEVTLLQVVAPGQHVHTVGGLDYFLLAENQVESTKEDARQYLEKTREKLSGTKGDIRVEVKVGDNTAHEIIEFAKKTDSSLIALSTHGHSDIREWVFGGVTHKVLHSSNASILLVRAKKTKV